MRSAQALALSLVISAAVAQQQYRPGSGFGGGSSGFGGSDGNGGFNDVGGGAGSGDSGSLEETIPGVPGDDYPIFAEVPETSFLCDGQSEGGYYADPEAECQVFHICGNDGNGGLTKYSFLCPNGTIFQQQYFVCDWWFNVDCSLAESLYSINEEVAAEREANTGAGGSYEEDLSGQGGLQIRGQTGGQGGLQVRGQTGGQGGPQVRGQTGGQGGPQVRGQTGGQGGPQVRGQTGGQGGPQVRGQAGGQGGGRRGRPGPKRKTGGRRGGSQAGYLAPASPGASDQSLVADTGYGAPVGGQEGFDGAGDFPLLSQYVRNTRDSQYSQVEDEIMDIEA